MANFKDITGKRFGSLLVIYREENRIDPCGTKRAMWKCKCDCGEEITTSGCRLRDGTTKSCGCLRSRGNNRKNPGISARNNLYHVYVNSSKRRKLDFDLQKDVFYDLLQKPCYYCGKLPSQSHTKSRFNGSYIYNGIDRVDNTKGYTQENCVTCCKTCNFMKKSLSYIEFLNVIKTIYEYKGLGNQ